MKCLFICTSLDIGGIEMYLLRFLSYMKDHSEWEAHILCKSGRDGVLRDDFINFGVRVIPMRQGYFDPIGWSRLEKLIISEHYDAVCDFTANFAGIPMWLAWKADCKMRVSFFRHSKEFFKPTALRMFYCRFVNRLVKKFSTKILSNSQTAFENFFSVNEWTGDGRFKVIPNGIPWREGIVNAIELDALRHELNIPSDCKVVGHVGRFLPEKNHKTILDVAERFNAHNPRVIFLLVGRGIAEEFSEIVEQRALTNVRFAGERTNIPTFLSLFDAFYFPSKSEGQPNALLEAIAAGVPFVSSDISEIKACFPEWWGDKWLVCSDDISSAVYILKNHLMQNENSSIKFQKLVEWLRLNNSQEKRFEELARILSA